MSVSLSSLSLSLLATAALAQHHIDPFAGSGCNCTAFGEDECSINATAPANMTLYRMTPLGVVTLTEKNSADMPGDVSFIISRRTQAYECQVDPTSFYCHGMVQFEGDTPNSTDLVLEMKIEVDGQWGPYLYCNDVNTSDPTGKWACTTTLSTANVPNFPKVCSAANYTGYAGLCWEGLGEKKSVVQDMGDCCELASQERAEYWELDNSTMECTRLNVRSSYKECNNSVVGFHDTENTCDNKRVHQTVGLEDISKHGNYYAAGGYWYSHPANGECTDGHYVGDGSGCSWRHVATTSAINASCMYAHIDAAIEKSDPDCFSQCQPQNKTTECYNKCYSYAAEAMTIEELTAPWSEAVGRGPKACPQVDISGMGPRGYPNMQHLK